MDSLQDLLGQYSPKEPAEVMAVKRYIADEFGVESSVGLHGDMLVITVASAPLANALRLRLTAIQKAMGSNKKVRFRIG